MASFITTVRQMTEMFQRMKKQGLKYRYEHSHKAIKRSVWLL